MTLLLIRHGETALNAARTLQPADTPLSVRGLTQARALAQRLAGMGITGIVSSDLPRALQTAQAIAAATGLPITTSALLQERNFGAWRGLPYDSFDTDPLTCADAPPGGESQPAVAQRVARAFEAVVRMRAALGDARGGTLAVVTHGLVLREMLAMHAALPAGTMLPDHLGNTCVTVIDATAPHAVTLLGCTRHLDTVAPDDAHALSGG